MKSDQGRTYMLALAAAALAGIPVAAAAVFFDSVVHGLTDGVLDRHPQRRSRRR